MSTRKVSTFTDSDLRVCGFRWINRSDGETIRSRHERVRSDSSRMRPESTQRPCAKSVWRSRNPSTPDVETSDFCRDHSRNISLWPQPMLRNCLAHTGNPFALDNVLPERAHIGRDHRQSEAIGHHENAALEDFLVGKSHNIRSL